MNTFVALEVISWYNLIDGDKIYNLINTRIRKWLISKTVLPTIKRDLSGQVRILIIAKVPTPEVVFLNGIQCSKHLNNINYLEIYSRVFVSALSEIFSDIFKFDVSISFTTDMDIPPELSMLIVFICSYLFTDSFSLFITAKMYFINDTDFCSGNGFENDPYDQGSFQ